ncbi:FCD domain-containing protein [Pseudonocardia eucalypti]|uniref:FCD domain-containing protein n=1 Tax=Pseudonocardia eucalypti TaxID=648755 RepID=A0ABP9Q7C7_9PSEU|nr:DNA-binding FadR family transcriptional regulator [Pseudonocardia eucalypti]
MTQRISHGARSALFAPLDQTRRAETVTRRLADAITLGLLHDDEQLPSETELAGRFGVATVTVREALVALRQLGLVETRRGRGGGSFVRAPLAQGAAPYRDRVRALSLAELRDIGDHYTAVAGTAAKLAAERASGEDLERLELACRPGLAHGLGAAARAERHFHLEVAAAGQSTRLTKEEAALQGEQGGLLWLPLDASPEHADRSHAEHLEIIAAIAAGDGERARRLTERHILDAVDRLAELHLSLIDHQL